MNPDYLIIFASGAGSNAQKIIDFFRNDAKVKISLIVCNKPGAGVLEIADRREFPLLIEKEVFRKRYVEELRTYNPSLIILAIPWKLPSALVKAFPTRSLISTRPLAQIRRQRMYGHFVHDAVVAAPTKRVSPFIM
jgi:phosphoribosylglycinamide formyltransferase-1